jgi:hypothetical protein
MTPGHQIDPTRPCRAHRRTTWHDSRFDWADPATCRPAVEGVDWIYLVKPVTEELGFIDRVARFLVAAAAARHTARDLRQRLRHGPSNPEVAVRAVELDLLGRNDFTHSFLRWTSCLARRSPAICSGSDTTTMG